MRKINRIASLFLAFALAAVPPLSYSYLGSSAAGGLESAANGQALHAFDIGPGVDNLSLGDQFAEYQWALKNNGQFQLVELKSKFEDLDSIYDGDAGNRSGRVGLPMPGPDNYRISTTPAVPGIDINITPAWELYAQAESKRQVIVAVIDTGIDYNHPDLANAIWNNPGEIPGDGIDNDGNGYIDDLHGWNFYSGSNEVFTGGEDSHGTHAAGTIAAIRGTGGIAGITDNQYIKVMPVKALGGSDGTGSPESVIAAIRYAESNGAAICNLSLGTSLYNEALAEAIKNSGMLFVVACGNGSILGTGYNTDQYPVYPASLPYDNVIAVSNLMFDGNLSRESNFGPESVDIAAPGTYILSTTTGGKYGFMSGTSMAAPMVTGVAAMLYSYRADISLADVKNILLNSARKLDTLTGKLVSGGMLDAYAALTFQ